MAKSVLEGDLLSCPVCLDTLTPPIIQCVRGHSFCQSCITESVKMCPTCRDRIDGQTRNYQLEQLIEGLANMAAAPEPRNMAKPKAVCSFKNAGCRYELHEKDRWFHEKQCRFRPLVCEANKFEVLKCNWTGAYVDLEDHFKRVHKPNTVMQFKTDAKYTILFAKTFRDIQFINFLNGTHYFYYKFKLDVEQQKAFWAIQFIGFDKMAKNFYYEFEVFDASVRKIKFTEICASDAEDINKIFNEERCAIISFNVLKRFLNEQRELHFRFRIIKKNAPNTNK